MTFHRWVIHPRVPDYLRLGWLALPSLEGTGHGIYSAHCVWLCGCRLAEPPDAILMRRGETMDEWHGRVGTPFPLASSSLTSPQRN